MTATPVALNPPVAAAAAPVLLGTQTAGSLLRSIVHIYRRYPGVVLGASVVPALPPLLLVLWLALEESPFLFFAFILFMVSAILSSGVLTFAISDICVGNRPDLKQSLKRVTGNNRWWDIVWAGLLTGAGVMVGMLLLVLPGIWFMSRSILVAVVATLEGRSGRASIRRSFDLTGGQVPRILGLFMVTSLLAYVAILLATLVVAVPLSMLMPEHELGPYLLAVIVYGLALGIMTPVISITTVLLYYDQRVRREAYDVQALTEDLMR